MAALIKITLFIIFALCLVQAGLSSRSTRKVRSAQCTGTCRGIGNCSFNEWRVTGACKGWFQICCKQLACNKLPEATCTSTSCPSNMAIVKGVECGSINELCCKPRPIGKQNEINGYYEITKGKLRWYKEYRPPRPWIAWV